jgi:predicted dehydrogenase
MKFLIIGMGSIGQRHAENLLKLYSDIELIAFRSGETKRKPRIEMKEYYNLDEALEERPLAAVISNPTSLHVPTSLRLAEAGVNLFIEKPISNNLVHVESLQRIVEEKNLTVMVGYNLRFHPLLKRIKEMILERELGRILFARIQAGQYLPDWHPRENYRIRYSAKKRLGGGVILDLSHEIDYIRWLLGDVGDVTASVGKISDLEIQTEDYAEILLTFNGNFRAEIHLDYLQRPPARTGIIVGKRGRVFLDLNMNLLRVEMPSEDERVEILETYDTNKMYEDEIKHFVECVRKKTTPIVDLKEGIKSLKVALAAKESSSLGRRIVLKNDG